MSICQESISHSEENMFSCEENMSQSKESMPPNEENILSEVSMSPKNKNKGNKWCKYVHMWRQSIVK